MKYNLFFLSLQVFSEEISLNEIKDIINMIVATYDLETGIKPTS